MNKYPNLFNPLKVGNIILRNRIIASPITKYGFSPSPSDDLEAIAAKVRGGAGMIILGSCAIDEEESRIHPTSQSINF